MPESEREWIEERLTRYRAFKSLVTDERALTALEALIAEAVARLGEIAEQRGERPSRQ